MKRYFVGRVENLQPPRILLVEEYVVEHTEWMGDVFPYGVK